MRAALLAMLLLVSAPALALRPGEMAPDFSGVPMAGGAPLKLSALRGKVVYVDFWASWCAPCRISLPLLNGMRMDLGKQGFEVLGVNVEQDTEFAQQLLQAWGVQYPVVRDVGDQTLLAYGIQKMPAAYVLDREGRVRIVHQGFRKSEFPALRAQIEALLREETK